jgi:hypothetical protein
MERVDHSAFLLPRLAFWRKHGSSAGGCAAQAAICLFDGWRMAFGHDQSIIVVELFAALDIAQREDENPSVFFPCLAIRLATMIDPARIIAVASTIDQAAVLQAEKKCMKRVVRIRTFARCRFACCYPLAGVFNYTGIGSNPASRKDTVAMNFRMSNDNRGCRLVDERFVTVRAFHLVIVKVTTKSTSEL